MSRSADAVPAITVRRPTALSSRLFFRVYSGPNPIGLAHLSSRRTASGDSRISRQQQVDRAPGVSYCLKIIEVSQNYRNRGVGSRLLDEVIGFCREQQVASLYGQARGESEQLRRWYRDKGFSFDSVDNIHLSLADT